MALSRSGRIVPKDLRNLAGRYFIRVTGVGGTVLGNKSGTEQSLVADNLNGPRRNELLVRPAARRTPTASSASASTSRSTSRNRGRDTTSSVRSTSRAIPLRRRWPASWP
jgi:hypothetical protein